MRFVYLIGGPAVGKTTLLDELVKGWGTWGPPVWEDRPVKHLWWRDPQFQVQLGHPRSEGFGGTDIWAFDDGVKALAWLRREPAELVIGEGDRFAIGPWLEELHAEVYWCTLNHHALAERRMKRTQDPSWVKGRDTKVARLAASLKAPAFDMARPVDQLVTEFRRVANLP